MRYSDYVIFTVLQRQYRNEDAMNIQFQFCGLCLLLLLFVFYKSHKTLQLYKEKVFYKSMCIIIVSLALDISSLIAIYFRGILPILFVKLVCKTYIISLIWGARSAFIYVFTDLYTEKKHRTLTKRFALIGLIQSIIVYFLPIYIYENGNQVYTYGASVTCVYMFVALYILSTLIAAGIFLKKLNPRRAFGIILWMVIWIGSAITQFFNSGLLIVGFTSAIGVLILFVIMENPEANLDRGLGCFNSYAMAEYVTQLMERRKKFGVLEIYFENSNIFEESGMDVDEVMREILHILKQYSHIMVFKNINLGLVLVSENVEELKNAGNGVLSFLSGFDSFCKEVMLILAMQGDSFENMDELFRFLAFIRTECVNEKGQLFLVNEEITVKYREKHLIEKEIADALEEDRVEVFLQPIYSNTEKCFTSAEALVRIRKNSGEFLSPGIFIPIAEDSGQILELGERVFEKVCDFLKNTNVIQLGIHYIEVNLSVIQCEQENLAERLINIAKKYDIDPGKINLEITETASISARKTLLKNMNELIKYGFTFSLDDFGKGESNLMYVVEMPVSIVKLDYDMSKAFFTSPKAKYVVRAVVEMAHGMDLKLVAEGIETKEEVDSMYQEKIDYIQGYYYSKPLPMEELLLFLKEKKSIQ